ncbi:rho guanine nucleotide exchange factor 16 [Lepisosteus oculatus]|uniref:rho guanine nucleotide exchange factor 16 n=1 Tax=Lepisosteus oculatus TaxID=7918 RepID=UPI00371CBDAB
MYRKSGQGPSSGMSQRRSDGFVGDQAPLLLENQFASDLQLDSQSGPLVKRVSQSRGSPPQPHVTGAPSAQEEKAAKAQIVLSTESKAALKLGTQQIIPKNLAVASRTKVRYHTTVVTLPVPLEPAQDKRASAPALEVSWDGHESDEEDCTLARNRRNQSYRAAVKSLDNGALPLPATLSALKPVSEEKEPVSQPPRSSGRSPGRKRTLGRKRNTKHSGSFKDEPRLYQEIRERGLHSTNQNTDDELLDDFVQLEHPEPDQGIVVKSYRPAQVTWSQLPQVQEQGILQRISAEERKRQEAIFEIITSEYSYLHSLGILVRLFKGSKELRRTMNSTEHHHLFSNISDIQAVSQRFFEDLEKRHKENPVIRDISDIVQNHAANYFNPYIIYCSNEMYQQRTLQKLLSSNSAFKEVLKQIEVSEDCGALPMISFLILPMQRVTRLPLLMDTICQKTPPDTLEYSAAVWALKAISKLVKQCNDGARRMERTEQMYTIQKQMEFGKIKPFPLISASRWLLKRGELAVCTEELSIFWKAFSNKSYYLFLFNDVLIVTRKKSEESYVVMDYATVENVEVDILDKSEVQPSPTGKLTGSSSLYSLKVLMKKNSEGRAEQIALVTESQIERARWVTALRRHKQAKNINKEELPQFEVIKAYMPKEPDELGLQQADVVLVLQKEEGWYHGERLRDGEHGWFPASCANEITNRVAVERNVRRMERLRKETNV